MTQFEKTLQPESYRHYLEYAQMLRAQFAGLDTREIIDLLERINTKSDFLTLAKLAISTELFAGEKIGGFVLGAAAFTLMTELEHRRLEQTA
jgi:hypothetical protein